MKNNRTTIQDDMKGFLHRHPKMEMSLSLDSNHVIVDKEDWEKARKEIEKVQHEINSFDICPMCKKAHKPLHLHYCMPCAEKYYTRDNKQTK